MVVVENPTKVVQAQVPGQGRRFRGDTLHHATVAAHSINVVVEDLETELV